jgi:hypothetical protein
MRDFVPVRKLVSSHLVCLLPCDGEDEGEGSSGTIRNRRVVCLLVGLFVPLFFFYLSVTFP